MRHGKQQLTKHCSQSGECAILDLGAHFRRELNLGTRHHLYGCQVLHTGAKSANLEKLAQPPCRPGVNICIYGGIVGGDTIHSERPRPRARVFGNGILQNCSVALDDAINLLLRELVAVGDICSQNRERFNLHNDPAQQQYN